MSKAWYDAEILIATVYDAMEELEKMHNVVNHGDWSGFNGGMIEAYERINELSTQIIRDTSELLPLLKEVK